MCKTAESEWRGQCSESAGVVHSALGAVVSAGCWLHVRPLAEGPAWREGAGGQDQAGHGGSQDRVYRQQLGES